MNDNNQATPMITIAAAGARIRELAPHIMKLHEPLYAKGVSDTGQREARRALAILEAEDEALRTYVTVSPAGSAEDALTQIDVVALAAAGMADDDDLPAEYRELTENILRVLASAAGVLSDAAGIGLDKFTASGLDQTFSIAFPLAARSAFYAAELH